MGEKHSMFISVVFSQKFVNLGNLNFNNILFVSS